MSFAAGNDMGGWIGKRKGAPGRDPLLAAEGALRVQGLDCMHYRCTLFHLQIHVQK